LLPELASIRTSPGRKRFVCAIEKTKEKDGPATPTRVRNVSVSIHLELFGQLLEIETVISLQEVVNLLLYAVAFAAPFLTFALALARSIARTRMRSAVAAVNMHWRTSQHLPALQ